MMYRSAKATLTMNCEDPSVDVYLYWRSEVDGNPDWAKEATSFGQGYVGQKVSPNHQHKVLFPANLQLRITFRISPTSEGKIYRPPELPIQSLGPGEEKDLGVWELVSEGESGKGATR
jgi:hypothetical protein